MARMRTSPYRKGAIYNRDNQKKPAARREPDKDIRENSPKAADSNSQGERPNFVTTLYDVTAMSILGYLLAFDFERIEVNADAANHILRSQLKGKVPIAYNALLLLASVGAYRAEDETELLKIIGRQAFAKVARDAAQILSDDKQETIRQLSEIDVNVTADMDDSEMFHEIFNGMHRILDRESALMEACFNYLYLALTIDKVENIRITEEMLAAWRQDG